MGAHLTAGGRRAQHIRQSNLFSLCEMNRRRAGAARDEDRFAGRQAAAISSSNPDTILVRGRDLCAELVGHVSFTDHVWLFVTGNCPRSAAPCLDATLVAIAEHGLVPRVPASRMTLAAAPEALQGAVAAGILGCGSVILGAAEARGALSCAVRPRARNGHR